MDFLLRNHEGLASDGLATELELFRDHLDLIWLADVGIRGKGALSKRNSRLSAQFRFADPNG